MGVVFALAVNQVVAARGWAQTDATQVNPILRAEILSPHVAVFQLRQYLLGRVAPPPETANAAAWTAEARRLRERMLKAVVFKIGRAHV